MTSPPNLHYITHSLGNVKWPLSKSCSSSSIDCIQFLLFKFPLLNNVEETQLAPQKIFSFFKSYNFFKLLILGTYFHHHHHRPSHLHQKFWYMIVVCRLIGIGKNRQFFMESASARIGIGNCWYRHRQILADSLPMPILH